MVIVSSRWFYHLGTKIRLDATVAQASAEVEAWLNAVADKLEDKDIARDHPHDWPDFDHPEPYVPPEDIERRGGR